MKQLQSYARLCTTLPRSPKKVLLQTQVDTSVGKWFDELAKANGHTRASFLRFIVEMFVLGQKTKHRPNPTEAKA